MTEHAGILFIGDPHLASRPPGMRKDDYPRVVLQKIRHCLQHAQFNKLVPVFLGDMFEFPRDNANWIIGELLELFESIPAYAVVGNHDIKENQLTEHDSLSLLFAGGALRQLSPDPVKLRVAGNNVLLAGASWGTPLPDAFDREHYPDFPSPLVVFVTHDDLAFPDYDAGRVPLRDIAGIDLVVNGHIHKPQPTVRTGNTTWHNPGNISRAKRHEALRDFLPAALLARPVAGTWKTERLPVPHKPFDEVFHPADQAESHDDNAPSLFISGLSDLEAAGSHGAGLAAFLDANLIQFDKPVADAIRQLAQEVLQNGQNE